MVRNVWTEREKAEVSRSTEVLYPLIYTEVRKSFPEDTELGIHADHFTYIWRMEARIKRRTGTLQTYISSLLRSDQAEYIFPLLHDKSCPSTVKEIMA